MTDIITQEENAVTNSNIALFNPQYLTAISNFAQVMASGIATVPKHLQGNPADCMAIAMQAAQWQMNPFAVAQKTFTVNGVLGYEAQLVNAVITTRGPLQGRLEFDWFGPWDKVIGKFDIRKNDKGQEYRVSGWKLADEQGIGIRAWATLKGEDEPRELVLLLAQARTRNSTLWADDPRQQLAYLAVKRWARLYCPEVILGVYSRDELEDRQEKEINPNQQAERVSVSQLTGANKEDGRRSAPPVDAAGSAAEFRKAIADASSAEQTTQIRANIESEKSKLGISAFTELKNKVVQRHRQITTAEKISALLTSCGSADDFATVEALYRRSERDLTVDDIERFQLVINDLRPEYQA